MVLDYIHSYFGKTEFYRISAHVPEQFYKHEVKSFEELGEAIFNFEGWPNTPKFYFSYCIKKYDLDAKKKPREVRMDDIREDIRAIDKELSERLRGNITLNRQYEMWGVQTAIQFGRFNVSLIK